LHGNNKSVSELQRGIEAGIGAVVIDSFDEIERLAQLTRLTSKSVDVFLRLTLGVEAHTHEFIATAHEDQKFGLSVNSGAAEQAALAVLAVPGLRLLGFHSHIGSQIFDPAGFEAAAERAIGFVAHMLREHEFVTEHLDLGGGLGIAYLPSDDPLPVAEMAQAIHDIVIRECERHGVKVPHLSLEPGRAIVGQSTVTIYEVGTVKPIELDGGAQRLYVSVDGGMSDNIRTALYDAQYFARIAQRDPIGSPVTARIVGKHCESGDIVVKDIALPSDIRPGDLIAVAATGAYHRSMASNYNMITRPAVVSVAHGASQLMIRRETEADLFMLDEGLQSRD
jgi:diaminopimelate decarboxylase